MTHVFQSLRQLSEASHGLVGGLGRKRSPLRLGLWETRQPCGGSLGNSSWAPLRSQVPPSPTDTHLHAVAPPSFLPTVLLLACSELQSHRHGSDETQRDGVLPHWIDARLASQLIIPRSQRETKL